MTRVPQLAFVVSAVLVLAYTALAQGGPPLRTDDPGTPGNGNWEVNLAVAADRRSDERVLEGPLLDINYGLGDRVQLKFQLPWVTRDTNTDETKSGLGNSLLGLKWRFYDNKETELQISTYPQFEFNNPTASADRGLVERGARFLMPLEIAKKVGAVNLYAELGYWLAQQVSDSWIAGLAAGHQMNEKLELLGKIYAAAKTNGDDRETTFGLDGRVDSR